MMNGILRVSYIAIKEIALSEQAAVGGEVKGQHVTTTDR